ncbi:hypothetical protein UCRPA7_6455 [Phaeoacremonium minimum UCRPA7]|uniref:Protein FAF1 n=1 Tax=Phaeoacremonium minimum (strain UCR-PA7) TaxID=1286976 RepID=R8BFT0_PHAM7|nr:hypothetical protein UCRPA7_6455 [Phaeoacremonium minimum UCRPA7]EON98144.1 hypothetical protein UCRPA7_6455 [Phaeoacremonium minimum UCRPA7]
MGTLLGKRKTRVPEKTSEAEIQDAEAIFRRHFEAQFKPLQVAESRKPARKSAREPEVEVDEDDSDSESADSEWGGISEDDEAEANAVEVIDHTSSRPTTTTSTMTKRELRAYLSSRPPSAFDDESSTQPKAKPPKAKDADPEDEDSATLLANDLALQRLIAESKILSSAAASPSADRAFAEGRTRRITTDMRLQALGSRDSVLAQKKMPMGIRKGIAGAAAAREEKRRREAKENGIILERAIGGGKNKAAGKRRRAGGLAVDMPGVGRMKGAELRLSQRDIRSMETPREKPGGKKRRRR